jgi:hypothetical protein
LGISICLLSPSACSGASGSSSAFSGVFITEELMELSTRGHQIPLTSMYKHSWKSFWTCSWDPSASVMKLFLVKSKTSGLGTMHLKCWTSRTSGLLDIRLKEFCCDIPFMTQAEDIILLKWEETFTPNETA